MSTETGAQAPEATKELTALDVLNARLAEPDVPSDGVQPVQQQAEQAETEEVKPEEPKVEEAPKQDDRFAAKFAALSRREKEIRQREQKALQRERDLEARLKALEDKEGTEESWKKNPLEMLKKKGLDYETLTKEHILKIEETPEQKQQNVVEELRSQLKAIQDQLQKKDEDAKNQAAEAQRQKEVEAKQAYLRQLTNFVNESGEKYELIKRNDAVQVVYDTMDELYAAKLQEEGEGYRLTPEDIAKLRDDAADAVEAHLLEEAKKIIESNKLKSLLGAVKPAEPKKEPETKKQPVTLSNEHTQQARPGSDESLSDDESKRKIAAILKWHE